MIMLPCQIMCEGCGKIGRFNTYEEAFNEGWDAPPYFTIITSCPECSTAEILIKRERLRMRSRESIPNMILADLAEAMIKMGHVKATVTKST